MKHFEDVWVEAERVAVELEKSGGSVYSSADAMLEYCKSLSEGVGDGDAEEMVKDLGMMLFYTAHICQEFGLNSWTALNNAMNDFKVKLNDQGEDLSANDGDG